MLKKVYLTLILMCFGIGISLAQNQKVSGKIKDSSTGEGIPGVSVIVKGTTSGTTTDTEGAYTIEVPQNSTLVFESVGMITQEVVVGTQSTIDVALVSDTKQLTEMVVTGLGEATDKRKVAISVESVDAKEFTNLPTASLDQALQGKVPGALIQSVSGQPGQQQNIILRAINSLGTTQPLVMIDGVQVNTDNNGNGSNTNLSSRLADLDLSNIERVEVVQGAAAATLFGAQGANGVIQIFTKRGKSGKTRVDFSTTVGVNNILRGNLRKSDRHFYDTDAQGFILNAGGTRLTPDPLTGKWSNPQGTIDANAVSNKPYVNQTYDQLGQIFKSNALSWNNSLNVSGGGEKSQYAVSVSNLEQQSTIYGSLNRTNVRLNLDFEVFKNFKVSTGSTLIVSTNTTGGITGTDDVNSPLSNAINVYPFVNYDVRLADGNRAGLVAGDNSVNPLFSFENRQYYAGTTRFIQSIGLNYKPIKYVELDYKYGFDRYNYSFRDLIKNQLAFLNGGLDPRNGQLLKTNEQATNQNSLLTAFIRFNLADDFGSSFKLSSTTQVAYDWRRYDYTGITTTVSGIPAEQDINLSRGGNPIIREFNEPFVTYGFLVNQRFDYDDFVGVSGGFRVDWSSNFGGNQAFLFGRADSYLRISQLKFWENLKKTVPELKIRAAYGTAGIQPPTYSNFYTLNASTIGTQAALLPPTTAGNTGLKVQRTAEFEVGFDAKITPGSSETGWFNYIAPSFVYFRRTSSDVILDNPAALSVGSPFRWENSYELKSRGFQLGLNMSIFENKKFSWEFTTNFSRAVTDLTRSLLGQDIVTGNNFVIKENTQLGSFFGIRPLQSITETNSSGVRYITDANVGNFEVVNGYVVNKTSKQVQFTNEKTLMGNATPKFNVSFINNFTYDNFLTLGFQLDWVYGFDVYNQTRQWMYRDFIHSDFANPVTINGQTGAFVNYYSSLYQTNNPNSHFVERASFVRLRDVSIRAELTKFLKIKGIRTLAVTISGRNLLTITNYSGMDPEAASGLNSAFARGLDQFAFPNFRSYNFGLNIGF